MVGRRWCHFLGILLIVSLLRHGAAVRHAEHREAERASGLRAFFQSLDTDKDG